MGAPVTPGNPKPWSNDKKIKKEGRIFAFPGPLQNMLLVYNKSVQSLSCVRLFATPWTPALQASLSITNSWSLLKLMSVELVKPSNHLIFCRSLLLPSIFPSIRVFSSESVLHRTRTASGLGKILFLPCGHVRKIPSRYCLVNLGARNPDREL